MITVSSGYWSKLEVATRNHAFITRLFSDYAYVRRIRPTDTPGALDVKLPWFVFPSRDSRYAMRFSSHAKAITWARKQVSR